MKSRGGRNKFFCVFVCVASGWERLNMKFLMVRPNLLEFCNWRRELVYINVNCDDIFSHLSCQFLNLS